MAGLDGGEEVVGGVIDAGNDVGETLGIGGPEDDYFVEVVRGLEGSECVSLVLCREV